MSAIAEWILVLAAGILIGWLFAHETVSTECDKLESFYVGSKTYSCTRK